MSRALVAVCVALALGGCSAILHPETYMISCMGTGDTDTCAPFGMICIDTVCHPFDAGVPPDMCGTPESCDGQDNNCNGLVDEDPASDQDHDAFSWCGTVSGTMPGPLSQMRVDCDDTDPTVYPGATELCDGKDNNCNHMIDEGATCVEPGAICIESVHDCRVPDCTLPDPMYRCAAGQICNTSTSPATCTSGTNCNDNPGLCTGSQICNTTTGVCVTPGHLGDPCVLDSDCASHACFDSGPLHLTASSAVCGQACCDDAGCPESTICWASGSGARSCVPLSLLGRTTGGTNASGAACSGNGDCTSGLCGMSGDGCIGACRSNSDCGSHQCGVTQPITVGSMDYFTLSCVDRPGAGRPGSNCCSNAECGGGFCIGAFPPGSDPGSCLPGTCAVGCGTNGDCSTPAFDTGEGYCDQTLITDGTITVSVPMCHYHLPMQHPSGHTGDACSNGRDCAGNFCDTATGVCRDTCCTDGDCSGGTHCRPGSGTYALMRCR